MNCILLQMIEHENQMFVKSYQLVFNATKEAILKALYNKFITFYYFKKYGNKEKLAILFFISLKKLDNKYIF